MSIKVLMLSTSFNCGGAEMQIIDQARLLQEKGYWVKIISLTPLGPAAEKARQFKLQVESINMRGIPNIKQLFELYKIISEWKPHIVHSHLIHANIISRLLRLFIKIPVLISTVHSFDEGKRWGRIAYRLTDPLAEKTVFVSSLSAERYINLKAVIESKTEVIPNGIEFSFFEVDSKARSEVRKKLNLEGRFIWLAVGRLEKVKDYPNLLRAFTQVTGKNSKAVLLIVGEGSQQREIKDMVKKMGISKRIHFLGFIKEIQYIMKAADALVLPSKHEGFGRVLVEAMACKLPVVATQSGGPREILQNGKYGILVPVGNPDSLARAMLRLMESYPESFQLDKTARYVKTAFDLEKIVYLWEQLYLKLLNKKGTISKKFSKEKGNAC